MANSKVEMIKVPAIQVTQKEQTFYIFSINAKLLYNLAYFKARSEDSISGIQRSWDKKRSREIGSFLEDEDTVLPNNIIINFRLDELKLNDYFSYDNGYLEFANVGESAYIIDGQHRLRAFEFAEIPDFELIVTAFTNLSLPKIAEIFVQINFNQTKVNKSLVFDLLSVSNDIFKRYAPYHEITEKFNSTVNSPWFGKIKMLGTGSGIISQATFIQAMEENKILNESLSRFSQENQYKVLWIYFNTLKNVFPEAWCNKSHNLCKSVGFHAQMRLLPRVLDLTLWKTNSFKSKDLMDLLAPLKQIDFSSEEIKQLVGKRGVTSLYQKMLSLIGGDSNAR